MADKFQISTSPSMGDLQPSMTLAITSKAKAMKKAGEDVASMCAGEPDFDTPEHIKEAAIEALRAGDTKYTPASGKPELRAAIAEKMRTENAIECDWEQVIVGPGAKFSVFSAVAALCAPGDEVLIPSPYWLSYPQMVKAAGAKSVFVQTEAKDNFCATIDALEAQVTTATKLLILNSPSNPTGGVYSAKLLRGIGELAVRKGFMVLMDEIYEKLVYDEECQHVSMASLSEEISEHTITVNGFSKAYAMTGWRLGYAVAPSWLSKKIGALQSHTTSNPTSFAQAGALAALQGSQTPIEEMRLAFAQRRNRIFQLLSDIPGLKVPKPSGAFYIFPDISSFGLDSMEFAARLLESKKVAVIPGKPFGADKNIRLSYACDLGTIETACSRLAEFCSSLA